MKRCLTIFLTLSLLLAVLPVPARTEGVYVAAATPLGDSAARISNFRLAAEAINGVFVPYGGSFSFNDTVGARTAERGYQSALNGRGAKVVGGGVAQAASTLYLALKQVDGISYDEKKTYGSRYNQDYVESGDDAILVDEAAGTDFAFTNFHGDMTIAMYISGGRTDLHAELRRRLHRRGAGRGEHPRGGHAGAFRQHIAGGAGHRRHGARKRRHILLQCPRRRAHGGARLSARRQRPRVEVIGGGVAQAASAVWLAVKDMADIAIVEKSTYGSRYSQNYVSSSADAILTDYNAGTDFSFRYIGAGSVAIHLTLDGDALTCRVTGGAARTKCHPSATIPRGGDRRSPFQRKSASRPLPGREALQSADKAHKRKNRSDKIEIRGDFCFLQVDLPSPSGSTNPVALGDKFCRRQNSSSAALASCGHLRLCKLPWMQAQLPWLAGFLNALPVC